MVDGKVRLGFKSKYGYTQESSGIAIEPTS